MAIPTDRRPIGFWLKLVDRLIDARLEASLGDLTRRQWQVLNAVQQGPVSQSEIDARVRPFLVGDQTTVRETADLRDRGWIAGTDMLALTDLGTQEFTRLLAVVSADRQRLMDGITGAEYAATVAILEKMARNMGWTPPDRKP